MFEFCVACQSAERPWALQRQRQGEYIRKKARVRGRAPLTKGVVSGEITLISCFERHEVSRVVGALPWVHSGNWATTATFLVLGD